MFKKNKEKKVEKRTNGKKINVCITVKKNGDVSKVLNMLKKFDVESIDVTDNV
jgi:hypothetical protein